jgi:plastocyanin
MRKFLAVLAAALSVVAVAGAASASAPAKKKPPVKLDGAVTNKGVGAVKGGKATIEADNFYFKKTFVKGKAGSTVSVEFRNEGTTAHTFTIDDQGIDEELQPGDSTEVKVKIPKNGKAANFYCRFHVSSGMQGALFSKAGGTAKAKQQGDSRDDSGDGGYGY